MKASDFKQILDNYKYNINSFFNRHSEYQLGFDCAVNNIKTLASNLEDEKSNRFIPVEERLPEFDKDVEVIFRNRISKEIDISTTAYNPRNGWKYFEEVFAWREIDPSFHEIVKKNAS